MAIPQPKTMKNLSAAEGSIQKPSRKTRSKTGCRTCRIRKVKCDEEKLRVNGHAEPQCRRCSVAQIQCEWQGGPIPRRAIKGAPKQSQGAESIIAPKVRKRMGALLVSPFSATPLSPMCSLSGGIQAANSLSLSSFDRSCLGYLQDSALVTVLGKHWPWSIISYAYRKIAIKEPMLMSMILASTASEIHLSRHEHGKAHGLCSVSDASDVDGRVHYGRALSGLREALKHEVKTPEQVEAIFITLWLLIDYENRFGSGAGAINIHIRGIETLLYNHVVPSLKHRESRPLAITATVDDGLLATSQSHFHRRSPAKNAVAGPVSLPIKMDDRRLQYTAVPLFLLWTLYFYTPGTLIAGPGVPKIDAGVYRYFLHPKKGSDGFTLEELYRISRQSPSRLWGEDYPTAAHLDDLDNLAPLTLYHKSHVIQVKITELFRDTNAELLGETTRHLQIMNEIMTISEEYDTLLLSAKSTPSCDIGDGRRVMETVYWASITFYGTIIYFYLCFKDLLPSEQYHQQQHPRLIPLDAAVSQVLELSLKLHRSRPHLILRIPWQLFIAGIATPDKIYQDWVSIRLRELGRYGRNFTCLSIRYDEIIQGSDPFTYAPSRLSALELV